MPNVWIQALKKYKSDECKASAVVREYAEWQLSYRHLMPPRVGAHWRRRGSRQRQTLNGMKNVGQQDGRKEAHYQNY